MESTFLKSYSWKRISECQAFLDQVLLKDTLFMFHGGMESFFSVLTLNFHWRTHFSWAIAFASFSCFSARAFVSEWYLDYAFDDLYLRWWFRITHNNNFAHWTHCQRQEEQQPNFIYGPEQHKMRSQLAAQFMPFFRLIAHILTFRDKKYRILTFRDKKYRILTFCDKTMLRRA